MREDIDALVQRSNTLLKEGGTIEDVLGLLRGAGCSVIDSITILELATGMNRYDAKRAVHYSSTWSDRRSAHDRFHEAVEEVINELTPRDTS